MKKITLLLILMCSKSIASDLVFKHGFEEDVALYGSVTGLTSTVLSLKLTIGEDTEVINLNVDGNFVFFYQILVGSSWNVEILTLPNIPQQQNCIITNNSGIMGLSGYRDLMVVCNSTVWNWDEMNWNQGGWN